MTTTTETTNLTEAQRAALAGLLHLTETRPELGYDWAEDGQPYFGIHLIPNALTSGARPTTRHGVWHGRRGKGLRHQRRTFEALADLGLVDGYETDWRLTETGRALAQEVQ